MDCTICGKNQGAKKNLTPTLNMMDLEYVVYGSLYWLGFKLNELCLFVKKA